MKKLTTITVLLSALALSGCMHKDNASWRVYVPFATSSDAGAKKAGIQGCIKGAIPAFICNH